METVACTEVCIGMVGARPGVYLEDVNDGMTWTDFGKVGDSSGGTASVIAIGCEGDNIKVPEPLVGGTASMKFAAALACTLWVSVGAVEVCREADAEGRGRGFTTGLNTAPPFSGSPFRNMTAVDEIRVRTDASGHDYVEE